MTVQGSRLIGAAGSRSARTPSPDTLPDAAPTCAAPPTGGCRFRLIRDRLTYGRRIPGRTNRREVKRGRDITWTLQALLRHVRDRWSIENSWHWVRDVPLREDAHRYRENNGVQIQATLRRLAINALRLEGIWSITEGIAALAHDITGLLRLMGWPEPAADTPSG